jgi:transcriptional regulator with XRE-family HTH domain
VSKPASPPKEIIAAETSHIGAAIIAARMTAGFSQSELAARTKTAQPNIGRLEKGGSLQYKRVINEIRASIGD